MTRDDAEALAVVVLESAMREDEAIPAVRRDPRVDSVGRPESEYASEDGEMFEFVLLPMVVGGHELVGVFERETWFVDTYPTMSAARRAVRSAF